MTQLSSTSIRYSLVKQWGSTGKNDGQLLEPAGIAVDSFDNVYVSDFFNNRIQKFSSNGVFITKWGSKGTENAQFKNPYGIAVDSSGNVYVSDSGSIQKFSSNGVFITKWGSMTHNFGHIAVNSSGNVYVSDFANNHILLFAPSLN